MTYDPVRSVRVNDEIWVAARERAERDGVTMSRVVQLLLHGYATDKLDLPKIELIYSPLNQG